MARRTERHRRRHDEERHPADEKSADDEAERASRSAHAFRASALPDVCSGSRCAVATTSHVTDVGQLGVGRVVHGLVAGSRAERLRRRAVAVDAVRYLRQLQQIDARPRHGDSAVVDVLASRQRRSPASAGCGGGRRDSGGSRRRDRARRLGRGAPRRAPTSKHKYLGVDDKDDRQREPEGAERREYCIRVILADKAGVRVLSLGAGPPAEERGAGDQGGGEPRAGKHGDADRSARKERGVRIANVARDEPVTVERDDDNVEDRRRAAEHVRRYPQIADVLTKCPAAGHLVLTINKHTPDMSLATIHTKQGTKHVCRIHGEIETPALSLKLASSLQ